MKILKKILATIMCVVMVLGTAPLAGFVGLDLSELNIFSTKAEAATSGTCGENLTWSFDEGTGVLTISGTGEMKNWNYDGGRAPWYSSRSYIKSINIENGVTSIGDYAFYNCTNITSITIADSVITIGNSAFSSCESLTIVTIPDGVTTVGGYAFVACSSLISVTVSDSVINIGDGAFLGCINIESINVGADNVYYSSDNYGVLFNKDKTELIQYPIGRSDSSYTIPESVTCIGDSAFYYCAGLTNVTIPGNVKSINYEAFRECSNLTNVTILDGVNSIGEWAFVNCAALEDVKIPDSVTTIGDCAFGGCVNLKNLTVGADNAYYSSDIFGVLFNKDKTELVLYPAGRQDTSYTIPDSVTNICDMAFYGCRKLTNVTIPDNAKKIGNSAFSDCSNLTEIRIPDKVESIGSWAFSYCDSLTLVSIPNSVTTLSAYAFYSCPALLAVTIGSGVTSIGFETFSQCTGLTHIVISDSVKTIDGYAFNDCTSLTDVYYCGTQDQWNEISIAEYNGYLTSATIRFDFGHPHGACGDNLGWNLDIVTGRLEISGTGNMTNWSDNNSVAWSFYTSDIQSVYIDEGATNVSEYAFYECHNLKDVTIPGSVKNIGRYAFSGCDGLKRIIIPESVKTIDEYAFNNCKKLKDVYYCGTQAQWNEISIEKNNEYLTLATIHFGSAASHGTCGDNLSWTFDLGTGALVINGTGNMTNWTSENNAPWHFYNYDIESVVISNGVTNIGEYAFYECHNLKSVTIPDRVITIGAGAFCYSGLASVAIGNSVTHIGKDAFYNCDSLTSVTIPDSVTTIGDYAFYNCESLTSVTIGNRVTTIGESAFSYCHALKNATIGNSVVTIGSGAFGFCSKLISIAIPDRVTTIGENAFRNCDSLTSVTIPDSVTTIGDYAFNDCGSLTSVTIGNSVTHIGDSAFASCKLTSVTIGNSVVTIGSGAFELCTELISIAIPDSVTTIGENAFSSCINLTFVTIPDSVTTIGDSAFSFCDSLRSVTIPDSVTTIGDNAFRFCKRLSSITVDTDNLYYSSDAFGVLFNKNKTSIIQYPIGNPRRSYTVPYGVRIIGREAFRSCGGLTSVAIPDSVTSIDFCAFNNCTDLTDVYYAGTKTEWNAIYICEDNAPLLNATIYFNSTGNGEASDESDIPKPIVYFAKKDDEKVYGTVYVTFKKSWFAQDNKKYNHELAQFCADYVMMGYCYDDDAIEGYLSQMGFDKVDSCMNAGRDEVNYFIASKDITLNGETKTLVFAAFIGSYKDQWYSNFDPYGTKRDEWPEREADYASDKEKGIIHLGFADAREYVYARLKDYIANNNIDKENMKLLISGHSRGAATANLLAAKLIDESYSNSMTETVIKENIYTYTFATPRPVSKEKNVTAEKYKSIFNIVNPEDFVTKVMLDDWGFSRYGITYVLPSKTNDDNYDTYLKYMRPLFSAYCGETYDPYRMGELKTYQIVKSMYKNVSTLDEMYTDKYTYFVSFKPGFESITERVDQKSPFDFFRLTLLKFLVDKDVSEILRVLLTCSLFYKDILQYFAWPDLTTEVVLGVELGGKFDHAHRMETYAAYVNSLTENQLIQARGGYENTVNCPVDIEVYNNKTNELVGKITNNVIDEAVAAGENAIAMDVDGDSKSFWLPSNGDYRVVLSGNDDGTMDYTVSSIDSDTGETQRVNFFDVEIENGVSMEGEFVSDNFVVDEYTLTHEEQGIIEPTEKIAGEELRDVSVNVTTEGVGYTDGNITVTSGDYVTLNAATNEGNSFLGWYENGVLVSSDAEYSFVAKENRTLVAKFTSNYQVMWNVDGEKTVVYFGVGETINMPQNPVKTGCEFIGWTPDVPATMPAYDLTFTAVFTMPSVGIKNNTGSKTINYGETLRLTAVTIDIPADAKIYWYVDGVKKGEGETFEITFEGGTKTVEVKLVDANGNVLKNASNNEIKDAENVTVKEGFFQKLVAFFKKLFGISQTVVQSIYF